MEIIAERSQRSKDRSDRACPAILTIPAIIWNSILSDRDNRIKDRMFSAIATILLMVMIVNDHMETKLNQTHFPFCVEKIIMLGETVASLSTVLVAI